MIKIVDTINNLDKKVIKYCTNSEKTNYGQLNEHFLVLGIKKTEDSVRPRLDFFRGNSGSLLSDIKDAKICENEDVYICKNPLKTTVVSPEKRRKIKEQGRSGA